LEGSGARRSRPRPLLERADTDPQQLGELRLTQLEPRSESRDAAWVASYSTDTETEAVDRALALAEDLAAFEAEVNRGLARLVGRGGFVDRFPAGGSAE
jgi:hypothetical protein